MSRFAALKNLTRLGAKNTSRFKPKAPKSPTERYFQSKGNIASGKSTPDAPKAGTTAQGSKLGALTSALSVLNPFSLRGALGYGTLIGGAATANQMFGPRATQQAIIDRDKVGGEYDIGPLGAAYEA